MAVDDQGKNSTKASKATDMVMKAFRATWKEAEIEEVMSRLESLRGQLILRMLLTLDAKSDALLGSQEAQEAILSKNTSDIVEVLAIFQKQTQAALSRTESLLTPREGHLTKLYEDVLGVVLTMRGGEKRRFMQGSTDGMSQSDQVALRLMPDAESSSTEVTVNEFSPSSVQRLILRSLYFRQIMDRFDIVDSPYAHTYDWIFSDSGPDRPWSSFPQWLGAVGSGCYWISGKAGSGKSTLMKYICQDTRMRPLLDPWVRGRRLITASFFFRGAGSELQRSQEGMLRSLLFKILSEDSHLIAKVMQELYFMAADDASAISPPSLIELLRWFKRLAGMDSRNCYCILIDGIDEFDGDPAVVVDLLSSVSQGINGSDSMKIVVSSRPIPVCVERFSHLPMLRLQDLTKGDIRAYVEGELLPRLERRISEDGDRLALIEQIVNKSCGVFIWVILTVRSLLRGLENRDTVHELRERLEELPSDLSDLYAHMMAKIPPLYQQQAASFFQLALEAMKTQNQRLSCPLLTLQASFAEDARAAAAEEPVVQITREEELRRCDEIEGRIRSRCCGLIETRRAAPSEMKLLSFTSYEYPCIDFLHRTVIEFLQAKEVRQNMTTKSKIDPVTSLFRSCAQMCRIIPPSNWTPSMDCLVYQMTGSALAYANEAEDRQMPISRTELHNLDHTLSIRWRASASRSIQPWETPEHWAQVMNFSDIAEVSHEGSDGRVSLRIATDNMGPVQFPVVAMACSLSSYFLPPPVAHDGSASLLLGRELATAYLHRASTMFFSWACVASNPSHDAPRRYARLVEICQRLLEQGADPNQETPISRPKHSVWGYVLIHLSADILHHNLAKHRLRGELDEVGLSLVEGLATLLIALVSHGADVNYQALPDQMSWDTSALSLVHRFFSSLGKAVARPGEERSVIRDSGQRVLDLMVAKGARLNNLSQNKSPDKVVTKRRNLLTFVNRLKPKTNSSS